MIIATIKKLDGTILDHGKFSSEEAAMEWFQPFIDKGVYGKKASPALFEDIEVEINPAILDEDGNEISPAQHEIQQLLIQEEVEAEFFIEFSQETESQEEMNIKALKYLAETDWYIIRFMETGADVPEEVSINRQNARDSIVR